MEHNEDIKNKIIGLGDFSLKKSYYPELQQRIGELNLFKTVFENTIDIVLIFRGNDGFLEYINEAGLHFFMLDQHVYNQYIVDFTNQKFWEKIKEILNEQQQHAIPTLFKSRLTINKNEFFIQSSLSQIKSNDIVYGSLIIRDITENVFKEIELIEAKEKAEESEKLKTSFLANMSHEIRTPLNAIIGFANLLDNEDLDNEKRKKYIEVIDTNCNDLLTLINDILDLSKLESGHFKINAHELELNKLFDDLYNLYEQKLQQRGNFVMLNCTKGLSDEHARITCDSTRLKQIIINLVDNAVKFTGHGVIHFGYELTNNEVLFFVKDTGSGIPQQSIAYIFDRFRQANHQYTRHPGGTGLGLSICQGLVSLMGGRIWAESIEGAGSEFFFTLPYNPSL